MATAPPVPTSAPAREVWRLSLENAARQTQNYHDATTGDPNIARRLAVSYSPEFPATGSGDRSFDICDSDGSDITFPTETADLLSFIGWGITHYESCPTLGGDTEGLVNRVRGELARRSSHLTEEVLWTGLIDVGTSLETVAAAEGTNNRRLASSSATVIDSGAHDLTVALGLINEWVADNLGPYRVWIHGSSEFVPFLAFYGQANRTDARSVESMIGDHRLVLGTGYDAGSAELAVSDGEAWLIVTNPVRVAYGEIHPGPGAQASDFINRSTNRANVAAQRGVLAEWDLTVHAAIKVCLPAPGPACS